MCFIFLKVFKAATQSLTHFFHCIHTKVALDLTIAPCAINSYVRSQSSLFISLSKLVNVALLYLAWNLLHIIISCQILWYHRARGFCHVLLVSQEYVYQVAQTAEVFLGVCSCLKGVVHQMRFVNLSKRHSRHLFQPQFYLLL